MLTKRIIFVILILTLLPGAWLGADVSRASAELRTSILAAAPELISQAGGAVYAVAYESYAEGYGYLYFGIGQRLYIYHVDLFAALGKPTLSLRGISEPLPDMIWCVSIVGNRAYVAMGLSGVAILDIANKDAPFYINHYDTPGFARGLFMTATTAYVADGESGLLALDISDPLNILPGASYNTDGFASSVIMANVNVLGDLFYVADGSSGLVVLDETTSGFVKISSMDTSGSATALFVKEKYIHLADGLAGWKKIKIADPSSLALEDTYNTPGYASDVMFFGGEIYVADQASGLRVIAYDAITGEPEEISSYDTPGLAVSMDWAEGFILMADYSGLFVIDVNSPSSPEAEPSASIASLAVPGKLNVVGDLVYASGAYQGLHIVDVANPVAPTLAGAFETHGTAIDVAVAGSMAYIADGAAGLLQVDVSSPITPTGVYTVSVAGDALGVVVEGDIAYVAAGASGLAAIQFYADPTPPQTVGSFDTPGFALDAATAGDYAYIADGEAGLVIVDRFPLDAASLVGSLDTPGTAYAVAVQGSTCYLADGGGGLRIIDVSSPSAPVEVGYYDTPGNALDIALYGNLAYVADELYGLQVINVASPRSPFLAASYDTTGSASGVVVTDNGVYVADIAGGLLIFGLVPERYSISLPMLLR